MNKSTHWTFRRMRTLRVNILTLFLSLLVFSLCCVISFTWLRQSQSVLAFSKGVAQRVIDLVTVRFEAIGQGSEQLSQAAAGFLPEFGVLSFDNPQLISYLMSVVKNDPNFASFYVGLPSGDFIGAYNQSFSAQRFYLGDATKPLPASTVFVLRYISLNPQDPFHKLEYFDADFQRVGSEIIPAGSFDARARPWFQGAIRDQGLFWTDFYDYYLSSGTGVSLGNPIYGKEGELLGVVGADLTLSYLFHFVQQQKVGQKGRVYILDANAHIIASISERLSHTAADRASQVIAEAFARYQQAHRARSGFVIEYDNTRYMAQFQELSSPCNKQWMVATIEPLDDFFAGPIRIQRQLIVMVVGILILAAFVIIYFAKRLSLPIVILAEEVDKISGLDLSSTRRVRSTIKEVALIDHSIAVMRNVVRSFFKYVPKEVVASLLQKNEEIALKGDIRELTIFFSNILDFTQIAESCPVERLNPLLSEYFGKLSSIINHSQGTIDKFLSDGIMAFWGAPLPSARHASDACLAALRCHAMLNVLNRQRRSEGNPEFLTRFGINLGFVIVGNIGTEDRINYTVIGDAVNTASRLLKAAKEFRVPIVVSEDVKKQLPEDFILRPLGVVDLKGKAEKVKIYELMGVMWKEGIHPSDERLALCQLFTRAYGAFEQGDLKQARTLFQEVAAKFPEDFPTQIYLQKSTI